MYNSSFRQFALATMMRSSWSRPPPSRDVFWEKTGNPHESLQSKIIPRRQRNDDLLLNLLPRLVVDHMKRGVWFLIWSLDDTWDSTCLLGYESGLGGFVATAS
jgi:hypothetical protein